MSCMCNARIQERAVYMTPSFAGRDEKQGYFDALNYTRKNLTTCTKSKNKPSTSCVRTASYKLSTSLEQVVNNMI